jgi:RNA ligase (TIGR02306 family)
VKEALLDDLTSEFSEANPLAEIVSVISVYKHPNADALDLVSPDGSNINYAVVKLGQFKAGDRGIWIDSVNDPMVPVENPMFSFLQKIAKPDGYARVKAMRLRGIVSRGLLIPLPKEWQSMSNREVTELLFLKKYLSQEFSGNSFAGGQAVSGPTNLLGTAKYDVESVSKNWRDIPNGTSIYLTEKIHGANASYAWLPYNGELKFWARSRTLFKKEPEPGESGGLWWEVAESLSLKERLSTKPGLVLYGEIYGKVQDLKYGMDGDASFVAFDCWDSNKRRYLKWVELKSLCLELDIPTVPVIDEIIWETNNGIPDYIRSVAEGKTLLSGDNIREGVVIRADISELVPNTSPPFYLEKRIVYKLVGNGYLTR